jgi:hypothetical protein
MFGRPDLTPYDPAHGPHEIGNVWLAFKDTRRLVCTLFTHSLGWELRLMVSTLPTDVFETTDQWKQDAVARGWRER